MAGSITYPNLCLCTRKKQANSATNAILQSNQLATLDQSIMFFNNGVAATISRKRKMQVVAETPQNADVNHCPTPFGLDLYAHTKQQPENKSMAMPFKSFTSLLIGDDNDGEDIAVSLKLQGQTEQMIKTYGDQLRGALADTWRMHCSALLCAAEERAAKRLREKELELKKVVRRKAELEKSVARFESEAQVWESKARKMEGAVEYLKTALLEANAACCGSGGEEEGTESSHVDPEREASAAALACKGCQKQVATVMMWPCRHVCICFQCDAVTKACPVCHTPKTTSMEVCIP